jgi:outer membrane lipoprotein-sorting protein
VNKFLRTTSTSHLLGAVFGLLVTAAVGTTIALAAIGSGPVPRRESLARAIRQGLTASAPTGVYARITFTDNLIASGEIQGSDPLLTGGSGRLWWTGHHLRLEIQGDNGDAQVVVNGRSFWAYDPAFNTVYRATLPSQLGRRGSKHGPGRTDQGGLPTVTQIQLELNRLARHLILSSAVPEDVAGQPAYSVRISPRHDNGLLGTIELAWDAVKRAPLQVGLYARGNPTPVLQLTATDISFGAQSPSVFAIKPPAGAKVVSVSSSQASTARRLHGHTQMSSVSGVSAVARRLPFSLDAPASLAGRSRSSVRLLSFAGHPAALLIYGHGLGSIVVLERSGKPSSLIQAPPSSRGPGLSLPTVTIGGATAQQLQTAIGTVTRFTRGGVTYTVLGSVTASVADAAARGL